MDLQKYVVTDPRVELEQSKYQNWYVTKGPAAVNTYNVSTTQFSNSNLNFQIVLPSQNNCLMDRSSVIIKMPIRITMNGPGTGAGNIFNPLYEGLRANCLEKITSTLTFTMGGSSIVYQPFEQSLFMEHYSEKNDKQIVPTYIDNSQAYSDTNGTILSPFAIFFDNHESRSSYPVTVISNNTTDAVIDYTLYWNLGGYPPFTFDENALGINLFPLNIEFLFISALQRIWSRSTSHPQALTSLSVTLGTNASFSYPEISYQTFILDTTDVILPSLSYPFHNVYVYKQQTSTAIGAGSYTATINNIVLPTLPARIYIGVKSSANYLQSSTANSIETPDVFQLITNVKITLGGNNTLMSNMKVHQLYDMCIDNGYNGSYLDWVGRNGINATGSGSVMCIIPEKDLTTMNLFLAGKSDQINYQAEIAYDVISTVAKTYEIVTLIVYDGVQTVVNNDSKLDFIPIKNTNELLQSPISHAEISALTGGLIAGDFYAGGKRARKFFKRLGIGLNKFLKQTKLVSKLTPLIPGVGSYVSEAAKQLGYGDQSFYAGPADGGYIAGKGGKILDRRTLKRNISKYRK